MGKMKELFMEEQNKAFLEVERLSYGEAMSMAKEALGEKEDTAIVFGVADKIADAYHRGCMHGISILSKNLSGRGL
jgi:hypothetical protein